MKGHATNVISVCWNSSGEYMASLSEDLIRVWKISSGEMQQCVHELSVSTKKFQCCLFHPSCPLSLIIGFNQARLSLLYGRCTFLCALKGEVAVLVYLVISIYLFSCFDFLLSFIQSLDIWHVAENKTITVLEQPISALAVSQYSGLVASVSDENLIKLWK